MGETDTFTCSSPTTRWASSTRATVPRPGGKGSPIARLAVADLLAGRATGRLQLWDGRWVAAGPAGDGAATPIFPAERNWFFLDTAGLWGPQPFYSRRLGGFVLVMNKARGGQGTPMLHPAYAQEGVDVSFNRRLADPRGWSAPARLALPAGDAPRWYAEVIGTGGPEGSPLGPTPGETESYVAGCIARLFMDGRSEHVIDLCVRGARAERLTRLAPVARRTRPPVTRLAAAPQASGAGA